MRFYKNRGIAGIVLATISGALLMFSALAIEVGRLETAKREIQNASDAATQAVLANLNPNTTQEEAEAIANQYIESNRPRDNVTFQTVEVTLGTYDPDTETFTATENDRNAAKVRVVAEGNYYLAKLFNQTGFTIERESIGTLQQREIMIIIDISGSMVVESKLSSAATSSASNLEDRINRLIQAYTELGSPTYGTLTLEPQILTGTKGSIEKDLGLDLVNYPYPSGSWRNYIEHVKDYDNNNELSDFEDNYSVITLIDYWAHLEKEYASTPDLWKTSQEPLTSIKDNIDYILSTLTPRDRVGLIIYPNASQESSLIISLQGDPQAITSALRGDIATNTPGYQAGHFTAYSPRVYGHGIDIAADHLETNKRPGAAAYILHFFDGKTTEDFSANIATATESAQENGIQTRHVITNSENDSQDTITEGIPQVRTTIEQSPAESQATLDNFIGLHITSPVKLVK